MTTSNSFSSLDWGPSHSLHFSSGGFWALLPSVTRWPPSYPSPSSLSQSASQRRGLLGWLRWALVAVVAFWLGASATWADQLLRQGDFSQAAKVFPYNRYIRTSPGYVALMRNGSLSDELQSLLNDPWSADLTFGAAILSQRDGNPALSAAFLQQFKRIAPNSPIAKGIP